MSYALRENLSCCRVDGHLVFLDVKRDRYFRLPSRMEQAFNTYLLRGDSEEIELLVRRQVLIPVRHAMAPTLLTEADYPCRSSLEAPQTFRLHARAVLEVLVLILSFRLQLSTRPLASVISSAEKYRNTRQSSSAPFQNRRNEERLHEISGEFRMARAYVPLDTVCLLDSLAMIAFLANRGLYANIVFGVTLNPFSAHCWVQAGDLVLNDTVGHANAYTPIRII